MEDDDYSADLEASGQSNPFNDPLTAPTPSDDANSTRETEETDNPAPDSYESFTEVSVKQNASREKVLPSSVAPTSRLHPVFGGASGSRRQSNASSTKIDHDLTTLKGSKLERDLSDVEIVVCDPQRIEKENYILYLVKTKTTRRETFDAAEYAVHRRYTDFVWLRGRLEHAFPAHLLPPMPEKHSLQRLSHFTPAFILARQKALNKFLNRIACHPVLSFNADFHTFLTTPDVVFADAHRDVPSLLSRIGETVKTSVAQLLLRNPEPQFVGTSEYLDELKSRLGDVRKIIQKLFDEEDTFLSSLKFNSMAYQRWLKSNDDLRAMLSEATYCIDKQIKALDNSHDGLDAAVLYPLKEYYLYTDSAKQVLRRRDMIQMDHEVVSEDLTKKQEDLDEAIAARQSDKVASLQRTVTDLEERAEKASNAVEVANSDLKAELDRWHKYKRIDMKELFTELADSKIRFHEESQEALKTMIEKLEALEFDDSS